MYGFHILNVSFSLYIQNMVDFFDFNLENVTFGKIYFKLDLQSGRCGGQKSGCMIKIRTDGHDLRTVSAVFCFMSEKLMSENLQEIAVSTVLRHSISTQKT